MVVLRISNFETPRKELTSTTAAAGDAPGPKFKRGVIKQELKDGTKLCGDYNKGDCTYGNNCRKGKHLCGMVINDKGDFSGSVSGGCVETAVVRECMDLIKEKKPFKKMEFKVSNESAWEVGFGCGGEIAVFLEQIN